MSSFSQVITLLSGGGDSHHHPVLASLSNVSLIRVKESWHLHLEIRQLYLNFCYLVLLYSVQKSFLIGLILLFLETTGVLHEAPIILPFAVVLSQPVHSVSFSVK